MDPYGSVWSLGTFSKGSRALIFLKNFENMGLGVLGVREEEEEIPS